MAENSKIEWTDSTWNPLAGCTKVSPGCTNCYAEVMARRLKAMGNINYQGVVDAKGRWSGQIALIPSVLEKPLHWKRPRMIFVDSMSDLFHPTVPSGWIHNVFQVMLEAKWHIFQVLTKRPERMAQFLNGAEWWINTDPESRKHIWLGTSVEDQKWAELRIPRLLNTVAEVRFLSCEPLLGMLDLAGFLKCLERDYRSPMISWVICGGESGPKARPMSPEWVRSLRDQCQKAVVPFFFKQWGEWGPVKEINLEAGTTFKRKPVRMGNDVMCFVGKGKAGALLDGQEWREFAK